MSKIFDALQGTRSEISDLLPDLIGPNEAIAAGPERTHSEVLAGVPSAPEISAYNGVATENPPLARRILPIAIQRSAPLFPFEDPRERAGEQYRTLRTKLVHHVRKPKLIVVSSTTPGDGKSVTAVNLACALSLKPDTRVLLVDADFRKPVIDEMLGMPAKPGLGDVLLGGCAFEDAVVQTEQYPNLHVLVNGEADANPSELLESERWRAFCEFVRSQFEYVVIDSPPTAMAADYELLQIRTDGTLLVVRPEHSNRTACLNTLQSVPKEKLIGVVLNFSESWFLNRHDNYNYPPASSNKPA